MNRRVLIVSPHFPPTNAPDMQRVRQALPYLPSLGWSPEVLAVDPVDVAAPLDPVLAEELPPGTPVHRVRAPRTLLQSLLRRHTLGSRARAPILRAGDELLSARNFDLVFFSTTQFAVMAAGPSWVSRHRVPYVVDWQDPWVSDYYDRPGAPRPPGGWRYRIASIQARRLEPACLRRAQGIVSVNDTYLRELKARYPWLASTPTAVIPFGAEPTDFERARRPDIRPAFFRRPGTLHLAYVGAAGPMMRPALERLFAGLRCWRDAHPGRSLCAHFVGTSYAPARTAVPSVRTLAEAAGVGGMIEEQPERVGHFSALRTLLEADALLLLGSDNAGYSPSKIATLALAGRPILALVAGGSPLEAGLATLGLETIVRHDSTGERDPVVAFLTDLPRAPVTAGDGLTALARTRELAAFFDRIAEQPRRAT